MATNTSETRVESHRVQGFLQSQRTVRRHGVRALIVAAELAEVVAANDAAELSKSTEETQDDLCTCGCGANGDLFETCRREDHDDRDDGDFYELRDDR